MVRYLQLDNIVTSQDKKPLEVAKICSKSSTKRILVPLLFITLSLHPEKSRPKFPLSAHVRRFTFPKSFPHHIGYFDCTFTEVSKPSSGSRQSRLRRIKVSLYRLSVYKSGVYAFLINCHVVKRHISLVTDADGRKIVNRVVI